MPQLPSLIDMLKAGVHFGHQTSKWHPKMRSYIYTVRHGIHIVDLEQTARQLDRALIAVRDTVAAGGIVLFASLKDQANQAVREAALEVGVPYITGRWLGGGFTNWTIISKLIHRLEKLEAERATGGWSGYTKKEQLEFQKDLDRLNETVGGIRTMTKLPELVFLVGVREGKNALRECIKAKVPVAALVDTDTNPSNVAYVVPGNDDALRSIQMVVELVGQAVAEGKKMALVSAAAPAAVS